LVFLVLGLRLPRGSMRGSGVNPAPPKFLSRDDLRTTKARQAVKEVLNRSHSTS
jgi:hypothetical protein